MNAFKELTNKDFVFTPRLLERFSRILGLNIEGRLGRLYTVLLLAFLCSLVYDISDAFSYDQYEDIKIILLWIMHINRILLVYIITVSILIQPKQYTLPKEDLAIIDIKLQSYGRKLENNSLLKIQILQIILIILVPLGSMVRHLVYTMTHPLLSVIKLNVLDYVCNVIFLTVDFLFIDYIHIINARLQELNKLIRQEKQQLSLIAYFDYLPHLNVQNNFSNISNINISRMRAFQHLHHELCNLNKKVNANFGPHLLFSSSLSIIAIIDQLYDAHDKYNTYESNIHIAFSNAFISIYQSFRLICISIVCQRTKDESRLTSSILHESSVKNKLLEDEVIHFSIQTIYDELEITAFGFFDINCKIICAIAGIITTYLIIAVQMESVPGVSTNKTS